MNNPDRPNGPEAQLQRLGVEIPSRSPSPIGAFCNVRRCGSMLFVSGQGPVESDGTLHRGKVGGDIDAETAREHSVLVALNILASLRAHLGTLDRVKGVIKLLGFVNTTPEFTRHPYVIDGASELFSSVFGENGKHARSSLGVVSLPNQITVEIEAIFEVNEDPA